MRNRLVVVLTLLVCLGTGGYAGQAWWANRLALRAWSDAAEFDGSFCRLTELDNRLEEVDNWRHEPWYGWVQWGIADMENPLEKVYRWWPRRSHYELLKSLTCHDFGNDPDAWEAWFRAHPKLVWDERRKCLVEPPAR